jgi:AcrR family transcriptional regulator
MRQEILHAAIELFLEHGFEKVSIRKIAERIEYSAATIYLYFKDKNEILYALHDEGFENLWIMQSAISDIADPLEKLVRHAHVYLSFAFDNPEYYDLMFIQKAPAVMIAEREEWNAGRRTYQFLKDNVRDCMENGSLEKGDLDAAAFAFWSLVHGIASLIIRGRLSMLDDAVVRNLAMGAVAFITSNLCPAGHGNKTAKRSVSSRRPPSPDQESKPPRPRRPRK